ncbi:hypothetical protein ABER23_13245 [Paenibacillus lautus]|uniref:hypothetical protein n=1 Tax=Paenibacillus lautus TaxID=1401 RepID=UPI003D2961CF
MKWQEQLSEPHRFRREHQLHCGMKWRVSDSGKSFDKGLEVLFNIFGKVSIKQDN